MSRKRTSVPIMLSAEWAGAPKIKGAPAQPVTDLIRRFVVTNQNWRLLVDWDPATGTYVCKAYLQKYREKPIRTEAFGEIADAADWIETELVLCAANEPEPDQTQWGLPNE